MTNNIWRALSFEVDENTRQRFFLILQGGFRMEAMIGCSVKEYLAGQCGIEESYISKRIQTVFLDGKPVDDIETALIHDGSVLSLSGAMPGLVGAVMRRGSPYASFRRAITHGGDEHAAQSGKGIIRLKLFNLIMRELGPLFLEKGIIITSGELSSFLAAEESRFWDACRALAIDREPADPSRIMSVLSLSDESIVLSVTV